MDVEEHEAGAIDPVEGPEPGEPAAGKSSRWVIELAGVVVVALVVAVLLRTFVIATYSIPSGSMEPTLQVGDRIVVNKLSYHLHGVDRSNIVVFSTPPNENCAGPPVANLVKRVIGLPGETISLSGGNVVHQRPPACADVAARLPARKDLPRTIARTVRAAPRLQDPARGRLRHG